MKLFSRLVLLMVAFIAGHWNAAMAENGSYYTGYKKMNVTATMTSEDFSVALLYPTEIPSKKVHFGPFEMNLSIGAPIANGHFPLVVISHGSRGTNLGYRSIAFALVKRGYVVAMPLHPKNNFKNDSAAGTNQNWKSRPLHIRATLDAILSNPKLAQRINAEKIAVAGHSAGGYTALAVAGGIADTAHLINLCRSNSAINAPFCGLVKENKITAEKITNSADKRVKAVVLMAPVGILFQSKDALDNVNIPILMFRAEKDSELTEPYQSEIIAKNYVNKALLTYCTVPNAGHYSFITPFPEAMRDELGVIAQDPDGFDRKAFQQKLSADMLTFFERAFSNHPYQGFQPTACVSEE